MYLLSFTHCLVVMNRTADMCLWTCTRVCARRRAASAQVSWIKGKALNLEEVGKIFFTGVGGNVFSSALCISPSRHLMSNQKEGCGKYCETELSPTIR